MRTRPRKVVRAIGNPSFVEFVGAFSVSKAIFKIKD